jgi:indolepyruvate ferredoxin oxidoreductase beta subunit
MTKTDILITGVGGQGILLASTVIGRTAIKAGLSVRSTETHGMAQRGGSVVSHLRIGNVYSPMIPKGSADFLIAFEPLEAVRNADYLKDGCWAVVNTETINPTGEKKKIGNYPPVEDILMALMEFANIIPIDATNLAREAGSPLTLNMVLLGAVAALEGFPLETGDLKGMVKVLVPPKTVETNIKAFESGMREVKDYYL